jgi:hypothetical protein
LRYNRTNCGDLSNKVLDQLAHVSASVSIGPLKWVDANRASADLASLAATPSITERAGCKGNITACDLQVKMASLNSPFGAGHYKEPSGRKPYMVCTFIFNSSSGMGTTKTGFSESRSTFSATPPRKAQRSKP